MRHWIIFCSEVYVHVFIRLGFFLFLSSPSWNKYRFRITIIAVWELKKFRLTQLMILNFLYGDHIIRKRCHKTNAFYKGIANYYMDDYTCRRNEFVWAFATKHDIAHKWIIKYITTSLQHRLLGRFPVSILFRCCHFARCS